ncbi:MAG: hypothetical protein FWC81_03615 [Coriobacteriia bacterium]|nr:hypothetical protein [Coriobacteriia bacterium]
MSKELIFKNDEAKTAFNKAVQEFGVDEAILYEPRTIRQVCMAAGMRYLFIREYGEKLSVYVPFGSAEVKNYKPALKVKKSLANERVFRDLHLPMSLEVKQGLIDHLLQEAQANGTEVIVHVKLFYGSF